MSCITTPPPVIECAWSVKSGQLGGHGGQVFTSISLSLYLSMYPT